MKKKDTEFELKDSPSQTQRMFASVISATDSIWSNNKGKDSGELFIRD